MSGRLIKQVLVSLVLVTSIRGILRLFPESSFWHLRELLDAPGLIVQGFIAAILYFGFSRDPSDYPAGVDTIFNFMWLYVVVLLFVIFVWRVWPQKKPIV